ncbi:MAG: ABC transporter permease [Gammaproteobacteria bacterium]|nr:MAG: ABC transporter permease [Gammaproteobacteria bacterium]
MNRFYLRLMQRQWRLPAIKLFSLAVALACAVTFSITLLGDRLEQLFQQQAKEVLAADLLLRASSPLAGEQAARMQAQFAAHSLAHAETVSFQSMAAAGGEFLLSSVKAVSASYPLRGRLQTAPRPYTAATARAHGPAPGTVWVEERVLAALGLQVGQSLTVGDLALEIAAVLVFEPDRGGNFYSFTPRILMHLGDLPATAVIQPGSRAQYDYLFAGAPAGLSAFKAGLEPTLQVNQRFVSIASANQTLADTLDKAYRFLSITSLIAILLGAVAVVLVSYHYGTEMTYQYAVLRCLGLRAGGLRSAIALPFASFTSLGVLVGLLLGGAAHLLILNGLDEVLPAELPAPSARPFIYAVLTAAVIVVSFAWPFLQRLLTTPPQLLLNRQVATANRWPPVVASVALGLLVLVQLNTGNFVLSLALIAGLLLCLALVYASTLGAIRISQRLAARRSVHWRLSVRILNANRVMAALQVVAIAMTFFSLALVQTLRDDLLQSWQAKVPANAPNFFVINLYPEQLPAFTQALQTRGISHSPVYPIVRGRLSAVNGEPVRQAVSKERGSGGQALRASNRDLSLTWAQQLPADNRITAGQWHGDPDYLPPAQQASVSVEAELAASMGIGLGDELSLSIETRTLTATVTSLRAVQWQSFAPNFYLMFAPQALQGFPTTYLASFHLSPQQRSQLPALVQQFASATFFDVDFLLRRVQGIIAQVSFAVESILYFALAASLLVFIAIEMILHHSRSHTAAVCKAVGARVALVQRIYRLQFILLGSLAGGFAYLLNLGLSALVSRVVMQSPVVFNGKTLLLCLLLAPLLVYLAGQYSLYKTGKVEAKQLLNAS